HGDPRGFEREGRQADELVEVHETSEAFLPSEPRSCNARARAHEALVHARRPPQSPTTVERASTRVSRSAGLATKCRTPSATNCQRTSSTAPLMTTTRTS